MVKKATQPNVITIIQSSINALFSNSKLSLPFVCIIFFQLLLLELLYFIPQWPLKSFFGPLVSRIWSATYMHYPLNLALLPKLFYWASIPFYILIFSFLICMAISVLATLNNDKEVSLKKIFFQLLPSYVYIVVAALVSFFFVKLFIQGYDLIYNRALQIRSTSGVFFMIKATVIYGAPYFKLFLNICGTALFAYVYPLIVIEKKNVVIALLENLKLVLTAPIKTFLIVFIPMSIYILILLLRNHIPMEGDIPEMRVISIGLSIFAIAAIDAAVYLSITMFYLLRKGK